MQDSEQFMCHICTHDARHEEVKAILKNILPSRLATRNFLIYFEHINTILIGMVIETIYNRTGFTFSFSVK